MFKIGDKVRVAKRSTGICSGAPFYSCCAKYIGQVGVIKSVSNESVAVHQFFPDIGWCSAFSPDCLEKVNGGTENKKGGDMKKVISEAYEKTQDALVVEKHLGCEITDNFMGGLAVKLHKEVILKEAKRKEAEEKKRLER